eukprot:CAMPEP_0194307758 /NCGR_PEP_ID=MMETSP0171-20130528/4657_1 /TAXON_ID=218684 /ORGANISM="Corethron pennatum, Strain L29A3" /LENGTH=461 /DNA_ID=CAMNT_0039059999 /DNA_START=264 /DNA_END=1652 /DNA_ORIENTATION=-
MKIFLPVAKILLSTGLLSTAIESSRLSGWRSDEQPKGDSVEDENDYFYSTSYSYSHSYSTVYKSSDMTQKPSISKVLSTPEPTEKPSENKVINMPELTKPVSNKRPTQTPTFDPTILSTPEPTEKPSESKGINIPELTKPFSNKRPTPTPSFDPTVPPTPKGTDSPISQETTIQIDNSQTTSLPTTSGSSAPLVTKIRCRPDSADAGSRGTKETPIRFYYDVQTSRNIRVGNSDWIGALEEHVLRALSENLLTCNDDNKLFLYSNYGTTRLLQEGLSISSVDSSPKDMPTGEKCVVTNVDAKSCIRMIGGFTITYTGEFGEGEKYPLTYVQEFMDKIAFEENFDIPEIVQIDYVGEDNKPIQPIPASATVKSAAYVETGNGAGKVFLVGSICAAIALIALLGLRRKQILGAKGENEQLDNLKSVDDCTMDSEKNQNGSSFDSEEARSESNVNVTPTNLAEF